MQAATYQLESTLSRTPKWYDYITINIYYLGLTTLSQTNGLIFPLLVQQFVGESGKATFFGTLRLWTLMAALLVQAAMGIISDNSQLRWGKRRPFILTGTLLDLVFITAIGFSLGLEGKSGYSFLFVMAILLQISSNIAHSAQQGLIPDLVPEEKRGRFSAVKAILELPVPLLLVSFTIARLISGGNFWAGILVSMVVLTFSMLVTMFVPEKQPDLLPRNIDWSPFIRLAIMTILFTLIILGSGQFIKFIGITLSGNVNPTWILVGMGFTGLAAMIFSVIIGVWICVRISLGDDAQENSSFIWWVINRLAYLVGVINLSTFAVFFIQARLGFVKEKAAQPAANLMLLVGICILLSAIPGGWLADRFGHKVLVACAGLLATLGTVVALLLPNLILIYIGGCLIGLATGIFYSANWALGTQIIPKQQAGQYLGISNLAGAGAGAVGAYIGGPIADYVTINIPSVAGIGYVLLFTIYGALFILSVVAVANVKLHRIIRNAR